MHCLLCGSETRNPKFCSNSCAASHNNKKSPKRRPEGKCKLCGKPSVTSRAYCKECWDGNITKSKNKIKLWLSGEWDGSSSNGLSKTVREYLLQNSQFSCQKCGFNKCHPADGKTILEINHIDGDGSNHVKENLEVLCPNCHAMTSSYRGRNWGKGKRTIHYVRVNKHG